MPSRTKRIFIRLSPQDTAAILAGLNWIFSQRKSLPNVIKRVSRNLASPKRLSLVPR
jgi:hypothetical protein